MKRLFLLLIVLIASGTVAVSADIVPQQASPAAKPFRIIFTAYDGDPKKPEAMSFQSNTVDIRQPSVFLKIGETIPNTNLRLLKFEQKFLSLPNIGEPKDRSELSVINTRTNEVTALILSSVHNLPAAAKNQ